MTMRTYGIAGCLLLCLTGDALADRDAKTTEPLATDQHRIDHGDFAAARRILVRVLAGLGE